MRSFLRILLLTVTIISYVTRLQAQAKTIEPANKTPLIDREILMGNPEISGGQLSPDGKFISFLKPYKGTLNIFVKKTGEAFDKAKQLTDNERPVRAYFWSSDGKFILYLKDKGGNENNNIYAVNPLDSPDKTTGIPPGRNLTPNDKIAAQIFSVSKKDPDIMMIGLNDRDPKWHDLYRLSISTGKLEKIRENNDRISGWVFDWNEIARLAVRSTEDGSTEILHIDENGKFTKVYEVGPLETASPLSFSD